MNVCIIYTREGEQALTACRLYARVKGWQVAAEYEDATGAHDVRRGGLHDAFDALEKLTNPILLVHRKADLSIDPYTAHLLANEIEKRNAIVAFAQHERHEDHAAAIQQVLEACESREREWMAFHKARIHQRLHDSGARVGRHPAYGERLDPNNPSMTIPVPEELPAIQRIVELRDGPPELSWRAVADRMNSEGWLSRGQKWRDTRVKKIYLRAVRRRNKTQG